MYWPTPVLTFGSVCGIRFGHIVQICVQQVTKKCEDLEMQWNILHACINTSLGHIILQKKNHTYKNNWNCWSCKKPCTSSLLCQFKSLGPYRAVGGPRPNAWKPVKKQNKAKPCALGLHRGFFNIQENILRKLQNKPHISLVAIILEMSSIQEGWFLYWSK